MWPAGRDRGWVAAGAAGRGGLWGSFPLDTTSPAPDEPILTAEMLAADPMNQFAAWMADAVAAPLPEPTAMVLATVSASGRPRARTVLLKQHDSGGFTFYTNRTSRKGTDLAEVPRASLVFPWFPMHRQVIVEGSVSELSTGESEPYFHSRPRGSQLRAWASRQSTVIAGRDVLEEHLLEMEAKFAGQDVPRPPD